MIKIYPTSNSRKVDTLFLLWMLLGALPLAIAIPANASEGTPNESKISSYTPKIVGQNKEKVQEFINYFIEVEKAEDDDDFTQGFPWRSFRASIEALNTPESAGWIIETLPQWVDGRDQESLAIMSKKAGELAGVSEVKMLLSILGDSNLPEENREWGYFIVENIKSEDSKNYLLEVLNSEEVKKDDQLTEAIKEVDKK